MKSSEKTKSIDKSLEDSTKAIDSLIAKMERESSFIPKQTRLVEDRLSAIHDALPGISERMLAYKLRRIADSKMLESVSAFARESTPATAVAEKSDSGAFPQRVPLSAKKQSRPKPTTTVERDIARQQPSYDSSTFRCKSDLDRCLLGASSALDKALCYALFIRCAIKG